MLRAIFLGSMSFACLDFSQLVFGDEISLIARAIGETHFCHPVYDSFWHCADRTHLSVCAPSKTNATRACWCSPGCFSSRWGECDPAGLFGGLGQTALGEAAWFRRVLCRPESCATSCHFGPAFCLSGCLTCFSRLVTPWHARRLSRLCQTRARGRALGCWACNKPLPVRLLVPCSAERHRIPPLRNLSSWPVACCRVWPRSCRGGGSVVRLVEHRGPARIYDQVVAVDEPACLARQVEGGLGDIGGQARLLERDCFRKITFEFFHFRSVLFV